MSRWLKADASAKSLAHREWRKTEKGIEYKKRHNEYVKEWRKNNKDKFHTTQKRAYDKARLEVLTHYSKGVPKCACCGEQGLPFLTIDHIAGNGSTHRKEIGMAQGVGEQLHKVKIGGNGLPYWLKKNNYPEGFQILCANCNFAKRQKPICPHQLEN